MARYGTPANPRRANPLREESPTSWRGLRKPGQESKIINRKELQAEYDAELAAQEEVLREKNANITGGEAAPAAPTTGGAPAAPAAWSAFSGVGGRSVGFNRESTSAPTPSDTPRESFAETETRKRRESAASGAFGTRAQAGEENLAARRGLFAEMKAAAEGTGGGTSDFRERAKALGIDEAGYARGIARAEGTEIPKPASPESAAPLQGRALAERNISTMGVQGAAADYFKRAGAERDAADRERIASAPEPTYRTGQATTVSAAPPVASAMGFARSFAQELNRGEMPETPSAPPLAANTPMEDVGDANSFALRQRASRAEAQAIPRSERNYLERQVSGQITATDIANKLRKGKSLVRGGVQSARNFRDRTNQASNLFGENLRKRLGIQ